jgi:hypothetical protein
MKLFQAEITEDDRLQRGSARVLNEVLHDVQRAYLEGVANNRHAVVTIEVRIEERGHGPD